MEHRGPSQEVRTQKRNRSPGRGHLRAQAHPTLRAAGGPSALGPADPAAPGPGTQFLFCPTGLRPICPVHLPLGSGLIVPEGRAAEGAGSAPGSDLRARRSPPPRPYSPDTLYPPIPRGRRLRGATPPPALSAPSAPLPRGPPRPLPPGASRRRQPGRGEERRTGRGGFRFRSHLHLGPRG